MALVKKTAVSAAVASDPQKTSSAVAREAELQRKRARTLAKQQQVAERVAAATGQLAAGINEAASAAEELRRSSDQIAAGAEEASGAAQESLAAFKLVMQAIAQQLQSARLSQERSTNVQQLTQKTNDDIASLIKNVGIAV